MVIITELTFSVTVIFLTSYPHFKLYNVANGVVMTCGRVLRILDVTRRLSFRWMEDAKGKAQN